MQRACGLKQFLATQNFNQFLRQRLRQTDCFCQTGDMLNSHAKHGFQQNITRQNLRKSGLLQSLGGAGGCDMGKRAVHGTKTA